jgi:hypothetical protein
VIFKVNAKKIPAEIQQNYAIRKNNSDFYCMQQ